MSFPIAHGLFAATIFSLTARNRTSTINWKLIAIAGFLGVLPDLDYLLNSIRIFGGGWHHGFSHSFVFAIIVGLTTAFLLKDFNLRTIAAFTFATASHAVLDFFITESRGVALLSPFSDYRYKLEVPNPIEYEWMSGDLSEIAVNIIRISGIEFAILLPIFLASLWIRKTLTKPG